MNLPEIANREIPKAKNSSVVKYKQGETQDIIHEVLSCFKDSKDQLATFAQYLKGKTVLDSCRNIWNFWKENIQYRCDDEGVQWVKTPAAVWSSKFCDCKSFSVAVAATLYALGIDGKFRFTSYGSNYSLPTHVYVIAKDKGQEIIIDCVWTDFNSQKAFAKNWDYNMTTIMRISGLPKVSPKGNLDIDVNDHTTTEAELDLALNKQQLEYEQMIRRRNVGIGAIGDATDNAYQIEIEAHNAALGSIGLFKKKGKSAAPAAGQSSKLKKALSRNDGKGVNKKQAKLLAKAGVAIKKRKETLLKKVAKGVKKVITAPVRLAAKTQLPKNAPFFLYLYLTDPKALALAPSVVLEKKAAANKYKNIMVNKLSMKESNFDKIIRNGIMNHFGKTPENVLAEWMKTWKAQNAIGMTELAAASLKWAGNGLKKLLGQFGENFKDAVENQTPAVEDWGGVSDANVNTMATMVQNQPGNTPSVTVTSGGYEVKPFNGSSTDNSDSNWNPTNNGSVTDSQDLEEVTVNSKKEIVPVDPDEPAEGSGSGLGMLLLIGAAVAVSVK